MIRPKGSVRVERTFKVSDKIRGAEISVGKKKSVAAVVKLKGDNYVVAAPKAFGSFIVPADSFIDALHWTVGQVSKKMKGRKRE